MLNGSELWSCCGLCTEMSTVAAVRGCSVRATSQSSLKCCPADHTHTFNVLEWECMLMAACNTSHPSSALAAARC